MAQALVDRDAILQKRNALASFVDYAGEQDYRLTRSEIKMQVILSVAELYKEIDSLSKQFRKLDTEIQNVNWSSQLL